MKGMMSMAKYFVYMLRCADGTLYTGISTDVERRLDEHNRKTASKYTRVRLPVELVFQEEAQNRSEALKREAAIKKLTKKQKLSLIATCLCLLLVWSGCATRTALPKHVAKQARPMPAHAFLATKAPYPEPSGSRQEEPPKNCSPVHIEGLFRHGSRYPTKSTTIENAASALKEAKAAGNLSKEYEEALERMERILPTLKLGELTEQGTRDHFALGKRMGVNYAALFRNNLRVLSFATHKQRTRDSREYFLKGLDSVQPMQSKLEDGDPRVLRYFDYCKSYIDYKPSIAERIAPDKTKVTDIKHGFYSLCQLDYNLGREKSGLYFCSLLTKAEQRTLGEIANTETYYKLGPPADAGMSCAAIEPMFARMQSVVRGEKLPAADLAFAHAETVVPVSVFFEIFEPQIGQWFASEVGPMAANIQFVTYMCSNQDKRSYKVKLLYNERERHFNIPQCKNSYYCDWELVKGYYEKRKQELGMKSCSRADFDAHCNS